MKNTQNHKGILSLRTMSKLTISIPVSPPTFIVFKKVDVDNFNLDDELNKLNISCDNETIRELLGCCKGIEGIMSSEHSRLCLHFNFQSPQRLKMVAQYTSRAMLSGKDILEKKYKKEACNIMGLYDYDVMEDELFEKKWYAFVCDQIRQADMMKDY